MKNLMNTKYIFMFTFKEIKDQLENHEISAEEATTKLTTVKTKLKSVIYNIKAMYPENSIEELEDLVFDIEELIASLTAHEVENFDSMNEFAINRLCGVVEEDSIDI